MNEIINKNVKDAIDKKQLFSIDVLRSIYGNDISLFSLFDCPSLNPIIVVCKNEVSTFCYLTARGEKSPFFLTRGNDYNEQVMLSLAKAKCQELQVKKTRVPQSEMTI